MNRCSISVDIEASPAQVWSVMREVERWHEWTASVRRIRLLDARPLAVGSRASVRQPKLLPSWWAVTELRENRGFTWISRAPGLRATARHEIEPIATGARVTLAVEFAGLFAAVAARLTRSLNARYLALEAAGLKRRSEELARSAAASAAAS